VKGMCNYSHTKGHGLGDDYHGLDDKSQGLEDEGVSLKEDEVVPEGQQQAVLVGRALDLEDDRVYTDIPAYAPPATLVQAPLYPEWSLGSLPVSPSSLVVPSPIASPVATSTATISVDEDQFIEVWAQLEIHRSILHNHTQRLDGLPPTLVANIDRDVRELYTRLGDEIFLQRPVLALEAWVLHVDTRLADMSRARYDDHRLIHDMLVQQAATQRELQEMRGRVSTLEQERGRRES
ncbi:hypothetical protein Tco_0117210, partial [Tanacetum coccineum]